MNRLAQLRKERGLTQEQAAEVFGMKPRTYRSYEVGERGIDSEQIKMFAGYYGVTTDYFLCRTDERNDGIDEVMELRQAMRERPELSYLMNASKKAKPADVYKALALLEELKEESENR